MTTKLGALIARSAFQDLKAKLQPREINGAVLLGLDGVVIKGHGGVDADGFSGAIEIGHGMARHGLLDKIRDMMSLVETTAGPESELLEAPAGDAGQA